ncbi:histidinol dehydrogenase [Rubricoccus marinus]|uniref:Histidinol dehydrogenase n=1 Tax=Rubricoccus marinus TaxID=716817 RepID=A0A259U3Q4_9BACT|nr:histidinol dehydrogenase [Rubricoccus marinus]
MPAAEWRRPSTDEASGAMDDARAILDRVKVEGDIAITEYSQRFDGAAPEAIDLQPFESYDLPPEASGAIRLAHDRITRFAEMQRETYQNREFTDETGTYGQRIQPVASVGAYIPGGRHPLVSTALMTLVPARVAGVETRVAVSPSDDPAILAACSLAGATRFVRMGGAQAVGALAYGSGWAPKVDMIVGPGNAWVAAAKTLVQGVVGIDTVAGPSEVLVIAGPEADPTWLAWDLIAQAEHDPLAFSVLVSWSEELLDRVRQRLAGLPEASGAVARGGIQLVLAEDEADAIAFSDRMGPEHLHVHSDTLTPEAFTSYGSLFLGAESAVALGDYVSGPNHTLPTGGYAAVKGGLSVGDFLRVLTWQRVTPSGLGIIGPAAAALADAEGLTGHAESVCQRLQ